MPALRMTPTRLDLLRAVKAGKVKVDVLSYNRHAFRTDKTGWPGVTSAFQALQQERYVTYPDRAVGDPRTVVATVTDAGQRVLDIFEEPDDD